MEQKIKLKAMQNQLLRKKSISSLFLLHCQMNPAVDSPEDE